MLNRIKLDCNLTQFFLVAKIFNGGKWRWGIYIYQVNQYDCSILEIMFIFNYFTDMLFVLDKSDMFWIKVDHCPADGLCTNLLRDMLMGFCTYHLH